MLLLRLGLMTALLCHAATQHPLSPSNAGHFQGGAGCRSPSPPVPNALGRASGPAPVGLKDAAQDAPAAHQPLQAPHAGAQRSPPLSCRPPGRNTQEGHLPGLCYSCVVYLNVAISIRKRTKTQAAKLLHLHAKWGIKTVCTVWCVKQGGTGAT